MIHRDDVYIHALPLEQNVLHQLSSFYDAWRSRCCVAEQMAQLQHFHLPLLLRREAQRGSVAATN